MSLCDRVDFIDVVNLSKRAIAADSPEDHDLELVFVIKRRPCGKSGLSMILGQCLRANQGLKMLVSFLLVEYSVS